MTDDFLIALLEPLYRVDVDRAEALRRELSRSGSVARDHEELAGLIPAVVAWYERRPEVGEKLAEGLAALAGRGAGIDVFKLYLAAVAEAGRITPVLAASAAEKFIPVCACGDAALYRDTGKLYRELGPWGPYPLGQVTNGILVLLDEGGPEVASLFVAMIRAALGQGILEKPLIRLVDRLTAGIRGMERRKRIYQAEQLKRVVEVDFELARSYLHGLDRGLQYLKPGALKRFVDAALAGDNQGERYRRFLGLEAIAARELNRTLQTMAPLSGQLAALHRYLQARGGRPVAVRPLREIPKSPLSRPPACCTDGARIYLPEVMEAGADVDENRRFYRLLAGLELALIEAGSFTFDFEAWRAAARDFPLPDAPGTAVGVPPPAQTPSPEKSRPAPSIFFRCSDYFQFFALFARPELAEKLFNLAEFARVRTFVRHYYPGFAGRLGVVDDRLPESDREDRARAFVRRLYCQLIAGELSPESLAAPFAELGRQLFALAGPLLRPGAGVAASADWVVRAYAPVSARPEVAGALLDFVFPFNRGLRFDLVYLADREIEEKAHAWRGRLAEAGVAVEKGLLRKILKDDSQRLTPELLRRLLENSGRLRSRDGKRIVKLPPGLDLAGLFPETAVSGAAAGGLDDPVPTFWYDEWDFRLSDYLRRHVKLLEHRHIPGDGAFYREALAEHGGLIRRIRRNFELIRPEAIQILRHWPEGDAFDYDALIEYAIDRRLRLTPDERIYRKRLKVERDVAVFVLVDLSSSTRKAVSDGGGKSILAVEKEALVLFCEALERVGDHFAIAGFSGSGRLAAEFFYLKEFADPLDDRVRARIGGLRPEKNTRMGPAVRHAARELKEYPARVKLMIILSDGLPNDQDYSNEYAIADSRAAIRESRSAFIHVHAITVNAVNSPHLDNLYGDVNHTVIADVRQLPDKLPRIYRALTRG